MTNYTKEGEATRLEFAKEKGFPDIVSRWKTPPVEFLSDRFEYVVVADDSTQVPQKLYRQLNAVLGHYFLHQEELEITHLNTLTIQKAKWEYLKEHPPAPKQTMINFWEIDTEAAAQ